MKNNPYNTPLTIDELLTMVGKPVYIADYDAWAIVSIYYDFGDKKVYLCGSRYYKDYDLSFDFHYDVEKHNFKIYRCPTKFREGD